MSTEKDNKEKKDRNYNLFEVYSGQERIGSRHGAPDTIHRITSRRASAPYSTNEIRSVIEKGTIESKRTLSRKYFDMKGIYSRIIAHYATLLRYNGVLIPHGDETSKLDTKNNKNAYQRATAFVDRINIPRFLRKITYDVLVDGAFYGVVVDLNRKGFSYIQLPTSFCRVAKTTLNGEDIIEFNLRYFDSLKGLGIEFDNIHAVVSAYPEVIQDAYQKYAMEGGSYWFEIPVEMGFTFSFAGEEPLFLALLKSYAQFEEATDNELDLEKEEIKKLLIQHIPHLSSGELLFEPEEAAEIHAGTVDLLRDNPNISVITTYGNLEIANSKTTSDTARKSNLDSMVQNIFHEAGTTSQIFATNNSQAAKLSLENDTALMMVLAEQFEIFIAKIVTTVFGGPHLDFTYKILPVTLHNYQSYVGTALQAASSGFSYIVPAVAMGLSQRELIDIKTLENSILELEDVLKPLATAFTQTAEDSVKETPNGKTDGRPELEVGEKSDKTAANLETN